MRQLDGQDRLCGAEINSITNLVQRGYFDSNNARIVFCHSMTEDGRNVALILMEYFSLSGYETESYEIQDLHDADPGLFRTRGLRNLAKTISRVILERGTDYCAINATGGYKAQIAIAVLLGQALGVPVFYKHEKFNEIIAFPPMPVALDLSLWMRNSGLFFLLDRETVCEKDVAEHWDERLEALVERVEIDGSNYLELSPIGQIFHETFRGRYWSDRDRVLPPPALEKRKPHLGDHDWGNAREPILAFMNAVNKIPYVRHCRTHYWNPDLPSPNIFRLKGEEIEGVFSNGTWTVKIKVETTAVTPGQREACVADLNNWLTTGK
ncbi:putative CRISPR-associated protein [Desulfofundulus thermosubterraneus]|uniref:CRISPR-associated protein, APE2256 family n=1 Tax=Desulfofundulus thermosubterraneus DSM 16057 TaxID=1121432 RepID=A0A1M6MNP6_9FIRM|nr:putative CRISPR-associated protein [Desulfofundulus thermosubterraneus]SHJ85059.1 CRISPR-associated protein, APE2256 family [Desulfofundulus thermosubterraneus DSM 16057]